jgi:hypothetical protein
MLHQPRPRNGTATNIRIAHQAIQTKTMPKLRLPTDVPNRPEKIANRNPARAMTMTTNCGQRFTSRVLMRGIRRIFTVSYQ